MTSALMSQKSNYYPGQKVVVYKYRSWSAYQNQKRDKELFLAMKPSLDEYIEREKMKDEEFFNDDETLSPRK